MLITIPCTRHSLSAAIPPLLLYLLLFEYPKFRNLLNTSTKGRGIKTTMSLRLSACTKEDKLPNQNLFTCQDYIWLYTAHVRHPFGKTHTQFTALFSTSWKLIYFLCVCMVLLHSLVLCELCPFFSTYGVSLGPLEVGYRATRVFDSGWIEYYVWVSVHHKLIHIKNQRDATWQYVY